MRYKTFEQWEAQGLHVIIGEKSHKRNKADQPVFSEEQVDYDEEDWRIYADFDDDWGQS